MVASKVAQERRQDVADDPLGCGDHHVAADLRIATEHFATERQELAFDALAETLRDLACVRHRVTRRQPFEEPDLRALLDRVDAPEDGRVTDLEQPSRAHEAPRPADGQDHLEVAPFEARCVHDRGRVRFCNIILKIRVIHKQNRTP